MEDFYGRMGVLLRGQGGGVEKITRAALLHHTWVAALADFRLEHYPLRREEDQIDLVRPTCPREAVKAARRLFWACLSLPGEMGTGGLTGIWINLA